MTQDTGRHRAASVLATWLAPVAAAGAAVALVAACSGASPQATSQSTAKAPVQVNVPPYYVALIGSQPEYPMSPPPADVAVVRATTTGAVLARITPPRPYTFTSVTGAANDRTFVLYGTGPTTGNTVLYGTYRQRLFLLHINPAAPKPSARAQLTELPRADIPGGQGRQLLAMAVAPDGRSLAVILSRPVTGGNYSQGELTVINTTSGTQRTWTRNVCEHGKCIKEGIGDGFPLIQYPSRPQLSWTSDSKHLLFIEGPTGSQVRLLDVDAPGTDLMADSHPLPVKTQVILWHDAVITPDGKTVFIEYSSGAATVMMNLVRFSATTGSSATVDQRPSFTDGRTTGAGPDDVLWTNYNGSKIIVLGGQPGPKTGGPFTPVPSGQTAGVYSGAHYTPLSWPANVIDAAW